MKLTEIADKEVQLKYERDKLQTRINIIDGALEELIKRKKEHGYLTTE